MARTKPKQAFGFPSREQLLAFIKDNPGKSRRFGADPGRSLGDHPDKGGPIIVKNGRYGAYVSHDGVNATLPADKTPDNVTLEEAVGLIDARIAAGGGGKKKKAASKAPAKSAIDKPATKAKGATKTASADKGAAAAKPKPAARKTKSKVSGGAAKAKVSRAPVAKPEPKRKVAN